LERQGTPPEAIREYRAALSSDAPGQPAVVCLCRHMLKENPAEALMLARRAAAMYPQSTRVKHLLIVALLTAGNPAEALDVGKTLDAQDPSDAVTIALLADAAKREAKPDEAAIYSGRLQRLSAGDPTLAGAVKTELRWLDGR
jgi:predicted Zn-dependent protease